MAILNILILDDVGTPSVCRSQPHYSTFATPTEANLFIITSTGGLCPADKARAKASCELTQPTTDGSLELIALAWHREHTIHQVYTPQEDLLIRAAGIRKLLGIRNGMTLESTVTFRDKGLMKAIAVKHGIPTTAYQRLQSPSDLLMLTATVGLPVLVKPTLGSASAGIRVLRTQSDVGHYLRSEFFCGRVSDESGQFDVPADIVAEAFLPPQVPMYHVNGLIENGKIVALWVFGYISTNLAFTQGRPYGNKAILPSDDGPLYKELVAMTQRVVDAFQAELGGEPFNTAFHCELFRVDTNVVANAESRILHCPPGTQTKPVLVLCEMAVRRPGGSIVTLMDAMQAPNSLPFAHAEFRSFVGLPYPKIQLAKDVHAADLLIPHKPMSTMINMPNAAAFPFSDTIQYIPSPCYPSGRVYHGYCVGLLNTVARFRTVGTMSVTAMESQLQLAHEWFQRNVTYNPAVLPTKNGGCNGKAVASKTVVTLTGANRGRGRQRVAFRLARIAVRKMESKLAVARTTPAPGHKSSARLLAKVHQRAALRRNAAMALVKYTRPRGAVALVGRIARATAPATNTVPHSRPCVVLPRETGMVRRTCTKVVVALRTPGIGLVRRIHRKAAATREGNRGGHPDQSALKRPRLTRIHLLESAERIHERQHAKPALVRIAKPQGHALTVGTALLNKVKRISGNAGGTGDWWMGGKRPVLVSSTATTGKGLESKQLVRTVSQGGGASI